MRGRTFKAPIVEHAECIWYWKPKLTEFSKLRSITLHGNPFCEGPVQCTHTRTTTHTHSHTHTLTNFAPTHPRPALNHSHDRQKREKVELPAVSHHSPPHNQPSRFLAHHTVCICTRSRVWTQPLTMEVYRCSCTSCFKSITCLSLFFVFLAERGYSFRHCALCK